MNVLVVDDQIPVVEGLVNHIHWDKLEVGRVFSACCAEDAKKIIRDREIDLLLCDIEMPGEDGLSLLRWVRENHFNLECIFLTAHADFSFAQQAIALGGADYILQPARYHEIEGVILKVKQKIEEKEELKRFSDLGQRLYQSRGAGEQSLLWDLTKEEKDQGGGNPLQDGRSECIEKVIQYIHCNLDREIHRSDVARWVNFNEDYVSRIFKKEKGISLKEYIIREKMKLARDLLRTTNFSIGTIAAKVGFDHFSHFSMTYKKIMGVTPMEERP